MNWKLSFAGECSGTLMATHSIHSPGDEGTRTRAGCKGDSVSSPNSCGKDAMVGNARFAPVFHECTSRDISVNWLETHNTAYLLDGGIVDTGSREVKVSHMV